MTRTQYSPRNPKSDPKHVRMNNAGQNRDSDASEQKPSRAGNAAQQPAHTGCTCGNAFHAGTLDRGEHAISCPQHPDNQSQHGDTEREGKLSRRSTSIETPGYEITDGDSIETSDVAARDTRPQS